MNMKLGFVSAILPDLSLEEVLSFAVEEAFECVELMCWPSGKAERRYAGVTHINVGEMTRAAADDINAQVEAGKVQISALGSNIAGGSGAQISALWNRAGSMSGLQIGALNFGGQMKGLQLGILNFNDNGFFYVFPGFNFGF